jgi:hypothetical protein
MTFRVLESAPTTPPVRATLLKSTPLVTATVLELADTTPPVPLKASKSTQFWKVMPDIDVEAPETMKAGPRPGGTLRLQQ